MRLDDAALIVLVGKLSQLDFCILRSHPTYAKHTFAASHLHKQSRPRPGRGSAAIKAAFHALHVSCLIW